MNSERNNGKDNGENGKKLALVNTFFLAALMLGTIFAGGCATSWRHIPIVVMWAWASLAVGGFLGLLFGIPRILKPKGDSKVEPGDNSAFTAESNNNLIEVSDWLTKIIVGVGLVELTSLPTNLRRIAGPLAECLGGCGLAIAAGVIVFFLFAGFLAGYINARTLISAIFIDAAKGMSPQELRKFEALDTVVDALVQKTDAPLPGTTMAPAVPAANTQAPDDAKPATPPSPDDPNAAQPPPAEPQNSSIVQPEMAKADAPIDPDDPNKGKFGGSRSNNDRILEATIEPKAGDESGACWVHLLVSSIDPKNKALTGNVHLYLHPTFGKWADYEIPVKDGQARETILSWGVFTVGAVADDGDTRLELDLSKVRGGTEKFYSS